MAHPISGPRDEPDRDRIRPADSQRDCRFVLGEHSVNAATPVPAPAPAAPSPPPTVIRPPKRNGWIYAVVAVAIIVIAGVAVGYEEHWFGKSSSPAKAGVCATGVTLQGNGAQFVNPLVQQWATAFQSSTSNSVNYVDSGSGTGVTDFSENPPLIDFAITDDPLSSSEVAALPSPALTIPVAGGALAVIYNLPGVSGHVNLTGLILADIYSGTISTWNNSAIQAINPGLTMPSATITTVHRSDAAGTTYVLTNLMTEDSPAWAAGPGQGISVSWPTTPSELAEKGNSAVLSTVQTTTDSIGYSDLTDVLTAKVTTEYAAIENPKGNFVVPTIADTASAIADKAATTTFPASSGNWYPVSMVNANGTGDYPLATFAFLFVYQNAGKGYEPTLTKSQVIVQWLSWVLTTGQTYSEETSQGLYYVSLPPAVVTIDQTGLNSMTFNGTAIPSCS
jgi:phosphate transport system substrate-binding protein